MLNFDSFLEELRAGALEIAKREGGQFLKEAEADTREFLDSVKMDLERWTTLLVQGKLTKDDYEFLVKGKKDLAKMNALTQAGLASVRVDQVRGALVDLITGAAAKLV